VDWRERNIEALERDACSMLNLYRRLLALLRTHRPLSVGDISLLKTQGDTLAYERRSGDTRLLVALNLGGTPQIVSLPSWARGKEGAAVHAGRIGDRSRLQSRTAARRRGHNRTR
jgi:alpha-glucosidase